MNSKYLECLKFRVPKFNKLVNETFEIKSQNIGIGIEVKYRK